MSVAPHTRRSFALTSIAAAVGGASLLSACGTASGKASGTVIVIGAGISGLAAAKALKEAGLDVHVVEARDRIGGRIHTDRSWQGSPLDLGASWIHGVDGNPITRLARKSGAQLARTSYESSQLHIDSDLAKAGVKSVDQDRWEEKIDTALQWSGYLDADISVGQATSSLAKGGGTKAKAQLSHVLAGSYTNEWGAEPSKLSAWWVDDGKAFGQEGEDVLFPNGYDAITRYLAKGLKITLSTEVQKVQATSKGITVRTNKGVLKADAVIVTVPLAVLAAKKIKFEPALPSSQAKVISGLGTGVLSKTFLKFDKAFWDESTDWHEILGRDPAWSQWVSLAKTGTPILLGFNGGKVARETESQSANEQKAAAMGALRRAFGSSIPDPVAVKTSAWSTDRYARGSYSYNTVGFGSKQRKLLTKPVAKKIFLAGEATEPHYHSTVHGAYLAGRRAARQVVTALAD